MSINARKRTIVGLVATLAVFALLGTACEQPLPGEAAAGQQEQRSPRGGAPSPSAPDEPSPSNDSTDPAEETEGTSAPSRAGRSGTATTKDPRSTGGDSPARDASRSESVQRASSNEPASQWRSSRTVSTPNTSSTQAPRPTTPPTTQAPRPTTPPTTQVDYWSSTPFRCRDGRTVMLWPEADQWAVNVACGQSSTPPTTAPPRVPRITSVSATYGSGRSWIASGFEVMNPESCPSATTISYTATYDTGARASGSVGISAGQTAVARPSAGGVITFWYFWPSSPGATCVRTMSYGW